MEPMACSRRKALERQELPAAAAAAEVRAWVVMIALSMERALL